MFGQPSFIVCESVEQVFKDYVPLRSCSGVWKELLPSIYVFDAPTVLSSNHRECICDVVIA